VSRGCKPISAVVSFSADDECWPKLGVRLIEFKEKRFDGDISCCVFHEDEDWDVIIVDGSAIESADMIAGESVFGNFQEWFLIGI